MESSNINYYREESSINSSNEEINEHGDQKNNIDLGVGRFYECVYCKRGFNTAQALGGHMNIHRKDRSSSSSSTRNKPITASNKQQQVFTKLADHQIIPAAAAGSSSSSSYHDLTVINHGHFASHDHDQAHLISTRSVVPDYLYGDDHYHHLHHHQEPPLDPMISRRFRLEFSNTKDHLDHMMNRHHDHKEELDLELRLGYDNY